MVLFRFTDGETREFPPNHAGRTISKRVKIVLSDDDIHVVVGTDRYTLQKLDDAELVQMEIGDMSMTGVRVRERTMLNMTPHSRCFLRWDGTYFILPPSGYVATLEEERILGLAVGDISRSIVRFKLPWFLLTRPEGVYFVCEWKVALFAGMKGLPNFVALNENSSSPSGPIYDHNLEPVLYQGVESYGLN